MLKLSTQYSQCNRLWQLAGQHGGTPHPWCPVFQSWCFFYHIHQARRVHSLTCKESGRWQPSFTLSVPHSPPEPVQSRHRPGNVPGQCLCPFGCHQAKWVQKNNFDMFARVSVLKSKLQLLSLGKFIHGSHLLPRSVMLTLASQTLSFLIIFVTAWK